MGLGSMSERWMTLQRSWQAREQQAHLCLRGAPQHNLARGKMRNGRADAAREHALWSAREERKES
jgi:hypothetical protein